MARSSTLGLETPASSRTAVQAPPEPSSAKPAKTLFRIHGLSRVFTSDGIDAIASISGGTNIHCADGTVLSVRKFTHDQLVEVLNQHMPEPFVSLRAAGVGGTNIHVNPCRLTGYDTNQSTLAIYFGSNHPVLFPGYLHSDLEAALIEAGRLMIAIDPASTHHSLSQDSGASTTQSHPAYDIDRFNQNFPGRV